MSILNDIIAHKRKEIEEKRSLFPLALLERSIYYQTPTVSLRKYLERPDKQGIIAEFKRRSPSEDNINLYASVEEVSIGYMQAGASALSVLTDSPFFGGKNEDLIEARRFNFCPVLRKDFVVDAYQIYEARSIGADAVLLIAEALSEEEVKAFSRLAKELGLEVLLEVHSADQLAKVTENVDVLGVNNRNLQTMQVSIHNSLAIVDQLPDGPLPISESGIHSAADLLQLRHAGYKGFLIGTQFMRSSDPARACARFIREVEEQSTPSPA